MIKLLVVSMFASYFVTFAAVAVVLVFIFLNRRMRSATFANKKAAIALAVFNVLGYTVAAVYRNPYGIIGLFGITAIVIIGQYMAAVTTKQTFTGAVDIACFLAPVAALTTTVEFVMSNFSESIPIADVAFEFRCGKLLYLHPNYLGTFTAIIATLCIYRFFTNPKLRIIYIFSGICCLVCIFLSGSMFACIELAISAIVMITYCRKWRSLAILCACLTVVGIGVIFMPEIIPRLDQADGTIINRFNVWQSSIEVFKRTPLFGEGMLSYHYINRTEDYIAGIDMYGTQHAHNIILDCLINFGAVGTAVVVVYIALAWRKVFTAMRSLTHRIEASLIIGVISGAVVHGMIDLTLLWAQPGLIFLLVVSASGFICRDKDCKAT